MNINYYKIIFKKNAKNQITTVNGNDLMINLIIIST